MATEKSKWGEVLDFYGHTEQAVLDFARQRLACLANVESPLVTPAVQQAEEADEIFELIKSGPPGNRIDLVFMVRMLNLHSGEWY